MAAKSKGFGTKCVHTGTKIDPKIGGVNTPIYTSTAHLLSDEPVVYPRYLNTPSFKAAAEKLASLENAKHAYIASSGMAAITTSLFTFLKAGDHLLLQSQVYGGTYHFVERELQQYGIEVTIVSSDNPDDYVKSIKNNTRAIYIESPSNPLLQVVDIAAFAKLAQDHGIVSMIDNTFATPINQNPLDLGIDVVIHSGTKYLGGHSDILCGAITVNDDEYANKLAFHLINHGGILDANALSLLERSMKTLALRIERHNYNAQKLAEFLEAEAKVKKVNYPGLKAYEGHEVAKRQMHTGFGGMLSFELDASFEEASAFVDRLKLIHNAASLGGVESLISMPCVSSHAKMTATEREAIGISDTLIRFSVGIEDIDDLIDDIKQALV